MRNIRKKINVKYLEVVVYNTVTKAEETINVTLSEVEKEIKLPTGCVEISKKVVKEKEVVYKMSPLQFVALADIED